MSTTQHPAAAIRHQDEHAFRLELTAEDGAQTAEYGIVTLAAVGFAGLLAVVLSGGGVQELLSGLIEKALNFG